MNIARILIGLLVVFAALWVVVGEQMAGASADATVNAPVVTLRAHTAGVLTLAERSLGARVEAGEALAHVEDALVDRVRLDDLGMERAFAAAATAGTRAALEELRALVGALEARGARYDLGRLEELETRLDHARRRLAILERGGAEALARLGAAGDEDRRRLDAVDRDGDLSARLPSEPRVAALVLDHARERVAVLEVALAAARDGVYLGDGYNDAPVSRQRLTDLTEAIAGLGATLAEQEAREAALEERLSRERVRVNALRGGEIATPVDGMLWEVLQADGVNVQRGDPILRVVDCSRTMVTLSVTERVFNDLSVGQGATFRLSGGAVHDATVARLAGAGAATVYGQLAVAPSQKHLERYDVALLVPSLTEAEGCGIGRTGRAFFDRRPLDLLR